MATSAKSIIQKRKPIKEALDSNLRCHDGASSDNVAAPPHFKKRKLHQIRDEEASSLVEGSSLLFNNFKHNDDDRDDIARHSDDECMDTNGGIIKMEIDRSLSPSRVLSKDSNHTATVVSPNFCARFEELTNYKKKYGDCLVPKKSRSHPQLGIWVMNQRAQYKLLQQNKPSTMTEERIRALEKLGFVWSMCDHVDWEERLEELRDYMRKYGDCLVPNKFTENPQLGTWVNKQRNQFKLMMEGSPSSMTPNRARALEELGFVWCQRDLVGWYSRLEELKQYKLKHSDCLVPNKYIPNPQLGTWVMHQRAQYRKLREGKPSPMTETRVKALEKIGFAWSIPKALMEIAMGCNVQHDFKYASSSEIKNETDDGKDKPLRMTREFSAEGENCQSRSLSITVSNCSRATGIQHFNSSAANSKSLTCLSSKRTLTYGATFNVDRKVPLIECNADQGSRVSIRSMSSLESTNPTDSEDDVDEGKITFAVQREIDHFNGSSVKVSECEPTADRASPVSTASSCNMPTALISKSVQTYDDTWKVRFNDLATYKEQHGDCLVPKKSNKHPQLGIWVMNQRAQYKLFQESKPSTMTRERIQALEELGMVWSMCDHVDWEDRLQELRHYKQKFGDCLVPNKFTDNPQLGTWVNKQRTQYKRMMEGSQSSMTIERARSLEEIGFVWSKRDLVDWYSRLEELKQYKLKHGDCLVPNKYSANPQLGTWVMHQRAQYRKLREGKPSPMTEERVTALEDVGFFWSTSNADADWNARIEELKDFKFQNGNCLVPNRYPVNPRLGTWVGKQRKQHKLFQEGKPCNLTRERIQALDDLGFVWSLRSLVDWDERLEEMKEYREKHGNCLVPQQYPENPQLGTWVSNQRKQFRLLREGRSSPMTEERVNKLEELGFVWSIFSHDTPSMRETELEELLDERSNIYGNKELLTRARDVVLLLSLSQPVR